MTDDGPSSGTPPSTGAEHAPGALGLDVHGRGPRLVLAHGFTQTARTWGPFAGDLAADHELVLVDLPGHGRSSAVAADLTGAAHLLVAAGGGADYLGYSMGARLCLHAALDRPDAIRRLVLVSGTAGLDDPGERAARRLADEALADELDPPDAAAPVPVDAFLHRWLSQPMFAGLDPAVTAFAERATNTGGGLASSLRLAGTGTQEPLWDRLHHLSMPVLVVTGRADEKFTGLGRRIVRTIGANASSVVVDGTGHAPHLERPGAVADVVRAFLAGRTP